MTSRPQDTAVGLDLGTTNTVVAYTPPGEVLPRVFSIAQRVTRDTAEARVLLPSCLYAPLPGELAQAEDGAAPQEFVVGAFAKARGGEIPARAITSAKSWLCHAAVDRSAALLPFGLGEGAEDAPRLSPVEASRRILAHVHHAWNSAHPTTPLGAVTLALTVPASFDDDARELTRLAADLDGLAVRLLEEPVAALYEFLGGDDAEATLSDLGDGALVLVCDVGGGTTDLSLVRVEGVDRAAPTLTRVASGRHILLGGDNMDLALAHALEERFVQRGDRLSPARFAELTAACRAAKERIFSGEVAEANVTLLGHGGKLVGGARTTQLSRELAQQVVCEGFFPAVGERFEPPRAVAALRGLGLPYERDPAITRHVASFLARHAALGGGEAPRAVLLNGGVFRSPVLARAFLDALANALGEGTSRGARLLPNPEPELAVARGAATYARLLARGEGARIRGGTARSYFVGLGDAGAPRAVCVVPRGAEEGTRHDAPERRFALTLGKRARFALFASDVDRSVPGDVVALDETRFFPLPPLTARLGDPRETGDVEVTLEGEVSQIGTLELGCVTAEGRRFRLAFRLEPDDTRALASTQETPARVPAPSANKSHSPQAVARAEALIGAALGKKAEASEREVKDLPRELERLLGDKGAWPADTARALADRLLQAPGSRRRGADHERVWFQLIGHCLRPGMGVPGDPARVLALAKTWEGRLAFPDEARGWAAFFVAFRRVAAGLDATTQGAIAELAAQVLAPKEAGLKRPKRLPEAQDELLTLAACLERVPIPVRGAFGEWFFDRVRARDDARVWEALGRLGARIPSYGPAHEVLAVGAVETWLERLLRADWRRDERFARAATLLARRTDDRTRDVNPRLRALAVAKLTEAGVRDAWIAMVRELVLPDADAEGEASLFEADLPPGLRLSARLA